MLLVKTLPRVVQFIFAGALLWVVSSPSPVRAEKWRFVFFSDSQDPVWGPGMNTNVLRELAIAATNERASFVLFGGDMVTQPQAQAASAWTNVIAPVLEAGIPMYPVIGNHDTFLGAYFEAFASVLPDNGPAGEIDRTYAFRYANALVVGLDALAGANPFRVNTAWLAAVLGTNQAPHVFVFSHPPAFKVFHSDCLGEWPEHRDAFWRMLELAGCRIYLSGHDHFFDHMRLDDGDGDLGNDIHQYICGTAGGTFYTDSAYDGTNSLWTPVRIFHEASFGYLLVEIDGDTVTATWKHRVRAGEFQAGTDVFTYTVLPRLSCSFANGKLRLIWFGTATLQTTSGLSGSFANVPNATSPWVVDASGELSLFFRLVR